MIYRVSIFLVTLGALIVVPFHIGGQEPVPKEVEAVRKYILERDYPEVFGKTDYKTRIQGFAVADLVNDGQEEVVIHYVPHYRQSATLVIYRVDRRMNVERVTEGLAPGPVQPVSGSYLDSHELGEALDLKVTGPEEGLKMFHATKQVGGGFVLYRGFAHFDGRKGPLAYVDMSDAKLPVGTKTCEAFEFRRVRGIAAGTLQGETRTYLAAWVLDQIYLYWIKKFREDGSIDKELRVRKAPIGFTGFVQGKGLCWATTGGAIKCLTRD